MNENTFNEDSSLEELNEEVLDNFDEEVSLSSTLDEVSNDIELNLSQAEEPSLNNMENYIYPEQQRAYRSNYFRWYAI